ncbi:MAG: CBS domain-containing protein [Bernardetiaceae bacterium]|nr:CBS domain-containing protein [Bernardetiaceae bacterium]
MASETLINEIQDFLRQYPPFDHLDATQLHYLASRCELHYFQENEQVTVQGDSPLPHFFVVKKGKIEIWEDKKPERELWDICDTGDIFGVRASLSGQAYLASATASEASLLYALPVKTFKNIMSENADVALFFAAGFASGTAIFKPEDSVSQSRAAQFSFEERSDEDTISDTYTIEKNTEVICCQSTDSITQVAHLMNTKSIGSMIVSDAHKRPLGIITDSDFRRKFAVSDLAREAEVHHLMSSPVRTIKPGLSVSEMTLEMVRHKITHLCVTEDGTPDSAVVNIVSQRDLITAQGNHPAAIIKEMLRANSAKRLAHLRNQAEKLLKSYLKQDVGIRFIANIMSEFNDTVIFRASKLAEEQMESEGKGSVPCAYAWLALGSEGRQEQLLRTDQDSALIYQDPEEGQDSEQVKNYFLAFAKKVTDTLNECGFEYCPADMMASNPKWCMPVSGWQKRFRSWILEPDQEALLNACIFFDFRAITGEKQLATDLRGYIHKTIAKERIFLSFLAKNALRTPPPLSFFRNFIVEKEGTQKDRFDMKARAMMPLTDAARVLAHELSLTEVSTFERFEAAAAKDENIKGLCEAAAFAYEILVKMRAKHGLKNKDSGRYITPTSLNKLERQTLRNIFKTIEKLKQVFEVRFRLGY